MRQLEVKQWGGVAIWLSLAALTAVAMQGGQMRSASAFAWWSAASVFLIAWLALPLVQRRSIQLILLVTQSIAAALMVLTATGGIYFVDAVAFVLAAAQAPRVLSIGVA